MKVNMWRTYGKGRGWWKIQRVGRERETGEILTVGIHEPQHGLNVFSVLLVEVDLADLARLFTVNLSASPFNFFPCHRPGSQ